MNANTKALIQEFHKQTANGRILCGYTPMPNGMTLDAKVCSGETVISSLSYYFPTAVQNFEEMRGYTESLVADTLTLLGIEAGTCESSSAKEEPAAESAAESGQKHAVETPAETSGSSKKTTRKRKKDDASSEEKDTLAEETKTSDKTSVSEPVDAIEGMEEEVESVSAEEVSDPAFTASTGIVVEEAPASEPTDTIEGKEEKLEFIAAEEAGEAAPTASADVVVEEAPDSAAADIIESKVESTDSIAPEEVSEPSALSSSDAEEAPAEPKEMTVEEAGATLVELKETAKTNASASITEFVGKPMSELMARKPTFIRMFANRAGTEQSILTKKCEQAVIVLNKASMRK